jgi:hypothetical protein
LTGAIRHDAVTGDHAGPTTFRRLAMNTGTYIPTVDPLGVSARIAMFVIFAITALLTAIHVAPIV